MSRRVASVVMAAGLLVAASEAWAQQASEVEVLEYQGKMLSPFERAYLSSVKGDQNVDPATYRLQVTGLVDAPQSLTYEQVLALPHVRRMLTIHCVDGWKERLLFEGIRVMDLLALAKGRPGIKTVIFYAVDDYSSSLDYDFVEGRDIIIAAKVNGLTLNALRGFPFQVIAEDKYGYKWVRWLSRIELSDQPYKGTTEQMGYSNEAELRDYLKAND